MTNALFQEDFIPETVYRSSHDYSASDIKLEIKTNGFTLWDSKHNPNKRIKPSTPALKLGSMLHKAVLEPNEFNSFYQVIENKRTKEGKEKILQLEEKGIEAISFEEKVLCNDICDAVANHPIASELFSKGTAEQSFFWDHKETNLPLKCRADWINGDTIIDLKTTFDASPKGFQRSVANYRYYVQASHYLDVVEGATGTRPQAFLFVAVEKSRPFGAAVYMADSQMIEIGKQHAREDLDNIAKWMAEGNYPGYSERVEEISLPRWMLPKEDGTLADHQPIELY